MPSDIEFRVRTFKTATPGPRTEDGRNLNVQRSTSTEAEFEFERSARGESLRGCIVARIDFMYLRQATGRAGSTASGEDGVESGPSAGGERFAEAGVQWRGP